MKPFNLEEAKAGKPVCMRDGRKVEILKFDLALDRYPLVAVVKRVNGSETVDQFTADGKYYADDQTDSLSDLIMAEPGFNLEAAKNGAKVTTREGKPVRILCFDRKGGDYPISGLVESRNGEEWAYSWTIEGACLWGRQSPEDITTPEVL